MKNITISPERTQQQTLNVQMDKTETAESKPLFKIKDIKNTPFKILHTDQGYSLVVGKHRLTNPMEQEADIHAYIETNHWEIIMTLIVIVTEKIHQENIHIMDNDGINSMNQNQD